MFLPVETYANYRQNALVLHAFVNMCMDTATISRGEIEQYHNVVIEALTTQLKKEDQRATLSNVVTVLQNVVCASIENMIDDYGEFVAEDLEDIARAELEELIAEGGFGEEGDE